MDSLRLIISGNQLESKEAGLTGTHGMVHILGNGAGSLLYAITPSLRIHHHHHQFSQSTKSTTTTSYGVARCNVPVMWSTYALVM
jgi:hypothetical protein